MQGRIKLSIIFIKNVRDILTLWYINISNRYINTGIYQHRDISTSWYFNTSIYQHLDISTPGYVNTSIYQHLDRLTPRYISTAMCQHLDISTNRSINTAIHQHLESIYQHRDTSTTQFINTAIYQHLDILTTRSINTAIHQHLKSIYQHRNTLTPRIRISTLGQINTSIYQLPGTVSYFNSLEYSSFVGLLATGSSCIPWHMWLIFGFGCLGILWFIYIPRSWCSG